MIHHTENETTVKKGQSIATVICDSENEYGERITTLELVYPRYIHSEFLTHRVFSRNSSSSRATPLSVTINEVINDPVFFDFVGKNQAGMVAGEKLSLQEELDFYNDWRKLARDVALKVEELSIKYGIHKQTLNRALEPFLRIRTLVTATEWDNFFKLRLSEDAQPEMRVLAECMKEAMGKSKPKETDTHLPYIIDDEIKEFLLDDLYMMSSARCARVSYARMDGRNTTIEDDLKLAEELKTKRHSSPFEHVAFADDIYEDQDNFTGWRSFRNTLGI